MKLQAQDFFIDFSGIFIEALPFIVLGSIIAGILEHAVPQTLIPRLVPRWRPAAIMLGGLLGLLFPMCECGIVPVMRRLLRKGLPLSCCVAYMLCGPVINGVVIVSTYAAFSGYKYPKPPPTAESMAAAEKAKDDGAVTTPPAPEPTTAWLMVGLRVGLAYVTGCITAFVIDRLYQKHGDELLHPAARPSVKGDDHEHAPPAGLWNKMKAISETALSDFVDISVFLTLGAVLSALCKMFIDIKQVTEFGANSPALAILLMMGLAIVLCLCSEADAFVAASFSSLPPAPKIAFLVLGPMLDLKLFMLFTRVFRQRTIWTIIGCVTVQSFVYSMIVHYVVPSWVGSDIIASSVK